MIASTEEEYLKAPGSSNEQPTRDLKV